MSVPHKIFAIMKSEWEGKGSEVFFYRNEFDHGNYESFCIKALTDPEMLTSHICWSDTAKLLQKNGISISRQAIALAYHQKSGDEDFEEDDEDLQINNEDTKNQAQIFLQHFLVPLTPKRVDLDKFM